MARILIKVMYIRNTKHEELMVSLTKWLLGFYIS